MFAVVVVVVVVVAPPPPPPPPPVLVLLLLLLLLLFKRCSHEADHMSNPPGALRWALLSKDGLPYSSNMEDISHIWWLCTCNEILVIFIYMYILFILFIYLIIYLFVYLLIYVSVGCISLLSYGRLDIFIRGSIGYWKVIQPCCL